MLTVLNIGALTGGTGDLLNYSSILAKLCFSQYGGHYFKRSGEQIVEESV